MQRSVEAALRGEPNEGQRLKGVADPAGGKLYQRVRDEANTWLKV